MKLNLASAIAIAALSAVSISLIGYTTNAAANMPVHTMMAQAQSVAIASGTFVAGEKPTSGTARVVRENGHNFLVLDSAFTTSDQGPDLHVLLDPASQPPAQYSPATAGRYINLGKLSSASGTQRYPIPDAINVANYQSVVVWCRMANATFGYAPLRPQSSALMR